MLELVTTFCIMMIRHDEKRIMMSGECLGTVEMFCNLLSDGRSL